MGSFTRFTRYIKDFWKVFIRGENDDLQRQTLSMQEELARLRSRRLASEKGREAAALNQAREAVQKLRDLHDNLIGAEQAAAAFAAKLGEAAKGSMEAHREMKQQAYKKFFAQQKQQMFDQQIVPELPSDKTASISSCSIEQEIESGASKLRTSRAVNDKDVMFAATAVDEPSSHDAVEVTVAERNGLDISQSLINSENNKDGASSSASNTGAAVEDMELMDEVPPEALAKMFEEAKRQVQLEEKSHIDALSRKKEILEKEIEARETAERAQS